MDDWEELLRRHGGQKDQPDRPEDGGARSAGSLIQQVRELGVQAGAGAQPSAADDDAPQEAVVLPDGYVRRSPVQRYRTPEDYSRRLIRKAVLAVIGLCFLALLVMALLKSGLLRFK